MDRSLGRKSIAEWQEVYEKICAAIVPRKAPKLPTKKLARALVGVRRAGKTTQAVQMTAEQGRVFYYNFEDPLFYPKGNVKDLDTLLSVAEEYASSPLEILILDEIHNVDGWERWLRKMIDQQRYRIIVTGSSAKLLSKELATALTGRVACFHKVRPPIFIKIGRAFS